MAEVTSLPVGSGLSRQETGSAYSPVIGWVLIAVCLLLAFPYNEATRNANELPRLIQGIALVNGAELFVDGAAARGMDLGPDLAATVQGRVVPNKPPGSAPLAAVAWQLTRFAAQVHMGPMSLRHYTFWARILGGVIPALWLWAWATQTTRVGPPQAGVTREGHEKARYLAATALVLATPMFSYAHLFYGHVLSALCLAVGIRMMLAGSLVGSISAQPSYAGRGGLGVAWLGGAVAGMAVAIEYFAVFAALPIALELGALAWQKSQARGPVVAAVLGACVPMVGLAWYHETMFGSPLQTGYHNATQAAFAAAHSKGLLGLGAPSLEGAYNQLLALDTGLFVWAPVVFVALVGLWYGAQAVTLPEREKTKIQDDQLGAREARVWLGIAVIAMFVVTGLGFGGGWRVGPRYIVYAFPAIAVGVSIACHRYREHAWVWLCVAATTMFGVVPNVLAGTLWPHLDPENIASPMPEVLVPLLVDGAQPFGPLHSLGLQEGGYVCVAAPIIAMLLALMWAAPASHKGTTLLGALCGLSLLGLLWLVPAAEKSEENLRYIERVYEPALGSTGTDNQTRSFILEAGEAQTVDRDPTFRGSGTW